MTEKMKQTVDQNEMLQNLPNFESSMPQVSTEEGAVLNISDTHWKLKIDYVSFVSFYLVNLVENLFWK